MHRYLFLLAIVTLIASSTGACGSRAHYIKGTKVNDTVANREILEVIEIYRLAVENKDAEALLLMASEKYWEDGGTGTRTDDYGYQELRTVLNGRFGQGADIRYSLRYMSVARKCPTGSSDGNVGCRAYVDVLVDASFSVPDARGRNVRRDKRDQNQIVLAWDDGRWKFLSGM